MTDPRTKGHPDGPVPGAAVTEQVSGDAVILTISGIADMASAPMLADRVGEVLRRRPAALVLDLTGVAFLATAGMSVIIEADRRCAELSICCRVVARGPVTLRPMQLLGVDDLLEVVPTLDAALAGCAATG